MSTELGLTFRRAGQGRHCGRVQILRFESRLADQAPFLGRKTSVLEIRTRRVFGVGIQFELEGSFDLGNHIATGGVGILETSARQRIELGFQFLADRELVGAEVGTRIGELRR